MFHVISGMGFDAVSVICAVILALSMFTLLMMVAAHVINGDGYRGCRRNTLLTRRIGGAARTPNVKAMTTQRILATGTDTGRHRMMVGR